MARRNWMEDYLAGRPDEMHTEEPKASAAGTNPYPYVKTDDKPVMPDDYGAAYREAVRRYTDMAPFSYDHTSDPRWQAYKKEYAREGARATEDTLGRYAAMTGGAPSTAAVTAAGQAGDYYAAKLADKIPELYDLAYAMYTGEADRLYRQLSALQAARGGELDRYRTQLSQWNADRDRADALGQQAWERGYRERSYADSRADKAAADAYQYAMATGDYSYLRDLGYDTSFLERQRDKEMAELDKPELSLAEVNAAIKAGNTAPNVLKAWEYYYGAPYEGPTGGGYGYGGYGIGNGGLEENMNPLAGFGLPAGKWQEILGAAQGDQDKAMENLSYYWDVLTDEQRGILAQHAGFQSADLDRLGGASKIGLDTLQGYKDFYGNAPGQTGGEGGAKITYNDPKGQYMVDMTNNDPEKAEEYYKANWDKMDYYMRFRLLQNAGVDDETARLLASGGYV